MQSLEKAKTWSHSELPSETLAEFDLRHHLAAAEHRELPGLDEPDVEVLHLLHQVVGGARLVPGRPAQVRARLLQRVVVGEPAPDGGGAVVASGGGRDHRPRHGGDNDGLHVTRSGIHGL
ncbi:translocation and assembly module TamA [Striga asiatica]|uniref:Translocation and assembly module TamA n=1 Tax=Striga asiatica TaxID=4170 RepID=A0A5A7NWZ5_STRAF|nr:translocation and assembly module TamA [Striga asiatica]